MRNAKILVKKIEEFQHETVQQDKKNEFCQDFQGSTWFLAPPPRRESAACPEQANRTSLHQKPHKRIYKG